MGESEQPQFTKGELRVIFWLRQGKRNREIAQALTITEVGVEMHLRNIYAKLQVRGRVEAVIRLTKLDAQLDGENAD